MTDSVMVGKQMQVPDKGKSWMCEFKQSWKYAKSHTNVSDLQSSADIS